ncbi:MAG: redoxin domain-containing protein [Chlorobi bacterium]|nr:redoxin domain-containing protein [Chlorobiota bacterium]
MKKNITIILILLSQLTFSQQYTISGNAATYTGDTLRMYKYSDNITKTKKYISKSYVDEKGNFSFLISEKDTIPAYIDLDVFVGKIILEPNKNLEIVLPKKTVRNERDRMNPYFKPYVFYVRVLNNENNITAAIKHFNKLFNASLENTIKPNRQINSGKIETEIAKIEDSTSNYSNQYFKNYKKYKYLYYRYLSFYKNKKAIIRKNFSQNFSFINNPAYSEMLEDVFGNFIFETQGNTLYKYLSSDYGWNAYMNFLSKDETYSNKEFREYFFLLNLYKLFYKNNTYQKSILKLLHSANNSNISPYTKLIVNNFLNKAGRLIVGNPVSDFLLPDENGFETSLSSFKGKFVYLSFYKKGNYACQKDIDLLNRLNKKKIELLDIVTIYVDANDNYLKEIKEKNDYDWTFLKCEDNDKLLKDYNIVAYPTYFLINPEGTLLLLPTPSPAENFEGAYFKIFQEWKREQIRKNGY